MTVKVGDRVEVVVEMLADLNGETRLSREKANASRPGMTWKKPTRSSPSSPAS